MEVKFRKVGWSQDKNRTTKIVYVAYVALLRLRTSFAPSILAAVLETEAVLMYVCSRWKEANLTNECHSVSV